MSRTTVGVGRHAHRAAQPPPPTDTKNKHPTRHARATTQHRDHRGRPSPPPRATTEQVPGAELCQ